MKNFFPRPSGPEACISLCKRTPLYWPCTALSTLFSFEDSRAKVNVRSPLDSAVDSNRNLQVY